MGRNLTNLPISASFQYLTQISGSELTDGLGADIDSLNISASYATSASQAENANTAISASYATTASFALNVSTPSLQEVTDVGSTSTNPLQVATGGQQSTLSGTALSTNGGSFTVTGGTTTNGFLTLRANDTNDVTLVLDGTTDKIIANTDITATNISGSGYVSASAFIGDGSQLSGISTTPFPFTGSAEILGTLEVGNSSNTTTGTYAVNFGGDGTANSVTGTNSSVLGGFGNTVSQNHSIGSGRQNTVSGGQIQTIMGGLLNTISATEATNGIFSGKTSTISGTSENSAIIGGVTSTIASHNRSVILGGTGLSTTKADEVVVPHLTISGSTIATDISASGYVSASSFIGDGSQITGLPSTDPFPYTGSAIITGSLDVIGNVILGESDNTITSTGTFNTIAGGTGNTIEGTADKGFVTGQSNTLGSSIEGAILGGSGNSISGGTINPVVIGSISSGVTGASSLRQAGIYSSRESTITGGAFYGQAIIASWSSTLNGSLSVIAGGSSQTNSGTYGFIGGGTNHTISSGTGRNAIVGGQQNTMSAGDASGILGGYLNQTTATTTAIVGGRSNTAGHQDSVVLGGDGLSTTKTQEAVVKHLTANGQVKGAINTLTDVAGTTTLDCSVGNYFTLAMPAGGTTVLTPSNITAGQTINIKITQNATAATLTYAASIDFPGGTPFTISTGSGEVDVLTLVSFDGTTLQATGLANFS